jgi:hypothetical protein
LSVIVSALDIPTVAVFEAEDKPILLIHSNTVKTRQVIPQSFQSICGWTS